MKMLAGGILLAVGILIAGASGICTLYGIVTAFTQPASLGTLPLVLVFGGLPFALGVALVFGGRSLIRQARDEAEQP